MGDRRRHQRFVMTDACEGTFQLLEDVTIEQISAHELRLLSAAPARLGEIVSVEVPDQREHGSTVFKGRVTESRPVMTNGTRRHVVIVKLTPSAH